jgi:Protein of unknown function (DUF1572)
MPLKFTTSYLEDSLSLFRYYKQLGERAMEQVTDEQLIAALDDEMNSIALTVKHMAGNMRSRWTDFLTTDGEKPDRNRDTEFVEPPATRESLMRMWPCLLRARTAVGERHGPDHHDSGRGAFGNAGHQPATRALRVSRRADRLPGEAPAAHELEIAERAAE